jgi:hypothetical protein
VPDTLRLPWQPVPRETPRPCRALASAASKRASSDDHSAVSPVATAASRAGFSQNAVFLSSKCFCFLRLSPCRYCGTCCAAPPPASVPIAALLAAFLPKGFSAGEGSHTARRVVESLHAGSRSVQYSLLANGSLASLQRRALHPCLVREGVSSQQTRQFVKISGSTQHAPRTPLRTRGTIRTIVRALNTWPMYGL